MYVTWPKRARWTVCDGKCRAAIAVEIVGQTGDRHEFSRYRFISELRLVGFLSPV